MKNWAAVFRGIALSNRRIGDSHICMEATGAYWEPLALYLHERGFLVSVMNPARIKASCYEPKRMPSTPPS